MTALVSDQPANLDLSRIKPCPQTHIASRRKVLELQAAPVCFASGCIHVLSADNPPHLPSSSLRQAAIQEYFAGLFGSPCRIHSHDPSEFRQWIRGWLSHYCDGINGDDTRGPTLPAPQAISSLLEYAANLGATDIHLDPKSDRVSVRLRIDGSLIDYRPLRNTQLQAVVNRIKVLAGLDIAENFAPQDGKFAHSNANGQFEIRVSTLPSQYGQRIALRLLPRSAAAPSLEQLGFTDEQQAVVRRALLADGGLIIASGPTGSGKSTALFSMMSELLLNRDLCGLTVEDPVEYEIPGATQVSLGGESQLDFATALRTMLRHDPDVLMVGEIRDSATARIATQAAMTGHLVLSTIHTTDVEGVRPRLIDLGVEEFLLDETLLLSIAGRLRPKGCACCDGLGCLYCSGSGRDGRTGDFQVRPMNAKLLKKSHCALAGEDAFQ